MMTSENMDSEMDYQRALRANTNEILDGVEAIRDHLDKMLEGYKEKSNVSILREVIHINRKVAEILGKHRPGGG